MAVLGGTGVSPALDEWSAAHDPGDRLLEGLADTRALADAMPYGVMMELLIEEWLRGRDTPLLGGVSRPTS